MKMITLFSHRKYLTKCYALILIIIMSLSTMALSEPSVPSNVAAKNGDPVEEIEQLEAQMLKLNRELFILEEDLLYPPETKVSVFVSWDGGQFFELDGVELKIDGQTVAAHLYTERQKKALQKDGLQQLYLANLKSGEHEFTAVITGTDKERGDSVRPMRQAATLTVTKTDEPLRIELTIEDDSSRQQPQLALVKW